MTAKTHVIRGPLWLVSKFYVYVYCDWANGGLHVSPPSTGDHSKCCVPWTARTRMRELMTCCGSASLSLALLRQPMTYPEALYVMARNRLSLINVCLPSRSEKLRYIIKCHRNSPLPSETRYLALGLYLWRPTY